MSRETIICKTRDEAIAAALRGAPPGERVDVHAEGCRGSEEPDPPYDVVGCTCTPLIMTAGAQA